MRFKHFVYLATVLLLVFLAGSASAEKRLELSFAEYDNPGSLSGQAAQFTKEEIEKATEGKVQIKIFWGDSLIKGSEALRAVQEGTVDMAHINPNYFPGQLPMNGAYALIPQGPQKYDNVNWLYKNIFEKVPELKDELAKNKQIPLFAYSVLPKSIASTKPIASLNDFKGKKIRASNRWALGHLEAVGAVPVSVPWSDCFMALQTGTVDAVYTNLDSIHTAKMDEVGKNVFLLKPIWSGTKFIITINTDVWKELPSPLQEKITEAMDIVAKRYGEEYEKTWDQVVKEQKNAGFTINSITEDEVAHWISLPVIGDLEEIWIAEQKKKGVANAKEILEKIKTLVSEAVKR